MRSEADKRIAERLTCYGPTQLSDAELLSLVLPELRDKTNGIKLAEAILAESGSLSALTLLKPELLRKTGGMGQRRAAALTACFELGRRLKIAETDQIDNISCDADVERIFRPMLSHLPHEEFWVLYLTAGNRILEKRRVSQGGVTGTVVDHKLIVKRAVELLSPSLIMVHNHPSGVAQPSPDDRETTRRVCAAAGLFDIAVLDHIIIASGGCYSFRHNGDL